MNDANVIAMQPPRLRHAAGMGDGLHLMNQIAAVVGHLDRFIGRIEAFYDQEAGQLRNGQIIGARETRARMIYELASIAAKKGITLAIDDIISTGGTPADASGIDAADSDFLNTCLSAADETLCRSMLPVFKDYRSRSNDPNG